MARRAVGVGNQGHGSAGRVVRRSREGEHARLGRVLLRAEVTPLRTGILEAAAALGETGVTLRDPIERGLRAANDRLRDHVGRIRAGRGAVGLETAGPALSELGLLARGADCAGSELELELVSTGRAPGEENQRQGERSCEQEERRSQDARASSCHRLSPWLFSDAGAEQSCGCLHTFVTPSRVCPPGTSPPDETLPSTASHRYAKWLICPPRSGVKREPPLFAGF